MNKDLAYFKTIGTSFFQVTFLFFTREERENVDMKERGFDNMAMELFNVNKENNEEMPIINT